MKDYNSTWVLGITVFIVGIVLGILITEHNKTTEEGTPYSELGVDTVQTKHLEGDTLYIDKPVEFGRPVVFTEDAIFQDSVAFGSGEVVFTEMPIVAYD